MKKILVFFMGLMCLMGIINSNALKARASDEVVLDGVVEMRGVWISTAWNLDLKVRQGSTSEDDILKWKTYFLEMLDQVEKKKLNSIFFQVRPMNDAFYESAYNPWSEYLVGYGEPAGWDPMEWMIKECHTRGIEFHAWLNPYRVGTAYTDVNVATASEEDINAVKIQYAKNKLATVKQNVNNPALNVANEEELCNNLLLSTNKLMCLNPASPAVIDHIVNTVKEIAEKYDVDGIHYDDYFYPSEGFETYSEKVFYNAYREDGGSLNLKDWRRNNVDQMVEAVNDAVEEVNKNKVNKVAFGISPAPVWAPSPAMCNDSRAIEGGQDVACGSYSTYHDLYADTKKWVENEWVDYILPQVYSSLSGTFPTSVRWWSEIVSKVDVKLYLGMSLSNAAAGSSGFSKDEIFKEMKWVKTTDVVKDNVSGYVYFSYQSFLKASATTLAFVYQYFSKGAITPVDILSDNPGSESGGLSCVEMNDRYQVSVNETATAKGYLLYAFDTDETQIFDKKHLVAVFSQETGTNKHVYKTSDKTPKEFVLKTLNLNNEVVTKDVKITTQEATQNNAPTIAFKDFVTKEYYLMNEKVTITVTTSDDMTKDLDVKMYHAMDGEKFRDEKTMTKVSENEYTITWEAFGISEEDNARIKIIVSDGDKTSEIITDYFKVYEKEPVKKYTVKFLDADGSILKEEEIVAGGAATAPTAPTKEGYNFVGWDKEFNEIRSDLEVKALYEAVAEEKPSDDKKGCKKDLLVVVVGLISVTSLGLMVWKKER